MAARESLGEKMWSTRAVPKSSRMVCSGLLKTCAMPLKSGAPGGGAGQRLSSGWTLGAAAAQEAATGTKAAEVWCKYVRKPYEFAKREIMSARNRAPPAAPHRGPCNGG